MPWWYLHLFPWWIAPDRGGRNSVDIGWLVDVHWATHVILRTSMRMGTTSMPSLPVELGKRDQLAQDPVDQLEDMGTRRTTLLDTAWSMVPRGTDGEDMLRRFR